MSELRAVSRQWDELSFVRAVRQHCPSDEADLIDRLLDHAQHTGARLTWHQGATPRVSSWYRVGRDFTAVWNLNGRAHGQTPPACLYLYLPELAKRLPREQVENACAALGVVPALAADIVAARAAGWLHYARVIIADLVTSASTTEAVFQAIDLIIDDRPTKRTDRRKPGSPSSALPAAGPARDGL